MNAQEAIEQFEILLNALKEQNEYSDVLLYGGDTLEPEVIQMTNKGFEALSIVLELAKITTEGNVYEMAHEGIVYIESEQAGRLIELKGADQ